MAMYPPIRYFFVLYFARVSQRGFAPQLQFTVGRRKLPAHPRNLRGTGMPVLQRSRIRGRQDFEHPSQGVLAGIQKYVSPSIQDSRASQVECAVDNRIRRNLDERVRTAEVCDPLSAKNSSQGQLQLEHEPFCFSGKMLQVNL